MTEDEFTANLDALFESCKGETKLLQMNPKLAADVRAGHRIESENFVLIEKEPGLFDWIEKE